MFLPYGQKKNGQLISVSEAAKGKQPDLFCPYCGTALVAKKGKSTVHHFAHDGNTCNPSVKYDIYGLHDKKTSYSLIQYHEFKQAEIAEEKKRIETEAQTNRENRAAAQKAYKETKRILETVSKPLNGKMPKNRQNNAEVLKQLNKYIKNKKQAFPELYDVRYSKFDYFKVGNKDIVYTDRSYTSYEIYYTDGGFFVPDVFAEHYKPLYNYHEWTNAPQPNDDFAKELGRIEKFTLYFLRITTTGRILHKIGITARTVEERIKEIRNDLKSFGNPEIETVAAVKGMVYLEAHFKRKYERFNAGISGFTEYFDFSEEPGVLEGIEQQLRQLTYRDKARIARIKQGMRQAKAQGSHIGRPKKKENKEDFLNKPKNRAVAGLLESGEMSIREIAKEVGCSVNTVQKVKKTIKARV